MVYVFVAGSPEALEKERASVTELLSRLGLEVVVKPGADESALPPAAPGTAARAFVDLRAQTSPWLVVLRGDSGRELERRTLPTTSSLELSAEEVALVLYMAIESSLNVRDASRTGGSVGPSGSAPASPPETAPPVAAPPASEPKAEEPEADEPPENEEAEPVVPSGPPGPFELELSVYGGASVFGATAPLGGFGAAVDVGARPDRTRFSGMLAARAFLPHEVVRDAESASLRAESARLFAAVEWTLSDDAFLGVALGGGADRITLSTGAVGAGVWSAGKESEWDPMASALATLRYRLSRASAVFVAAAADVDLAPHRYVVTDGATASPFFQPARVRPAAFAGLSFPLVGGSRD